MIVEIIDTFNSMVDKSKEDYTIDELKKILTNAYKSLKKKKTEGEKKAPSEYNLFIKEAIKKIKEENPDVDRKNLMPMAAKRWNEYKQGLEK